MPRTGTSTKNGKSFPVLVGALVLGALMFGGKKKGAASAPSQDVPPAVKRKAVPKPAAAKTLAQRLADNVRAKKYDYDRALCKSFQAQAKIATDGIYGPETRAALIKAGVLNPPPALFPAAKKAAKPEAPLQSVPPAPPTQSVPLTDAQLEKEVLEAVAKKLEAQDSGAPATPSSQTTEPTTPDVSAASLAQRLAADVRAKKLNYDRALCRAFQIAATGLVADGLYGGSTYNALKAYGVQNPPPALFKPAPSAAPYKKPTGS